MWFCLVSRLVLSVAFLFGLHQAWFLFQHESLTGYYLCPRFDWLPCLYLCLVVHSLPFCYHSLALPRLQSLLCLGRRLRLHTQMPWLHRYHQLVWPGRVGWFRLNLVRHRVCCTVERAIRSVRLQSCDRVALGSVWDRLADKNMHCSGLHSPTLIRKPSMLSQPSWVLYHWPALRLVIL